MHRPPRTARAPLERALAALVCATSLGATCVPNPNDHPPTDGGAPPAPDVVSFIDIEVDLKMSCGGATPACHGPTTANKLKLGPDRAANFELIKTFIDEKAPEQSVLLLKAIGKGTPEHGGGPVLPGTTDATYQKWLQWIKDGFIPDPSQKPVSYADIEKDLRDEGEKGCSVTTKICHGAGSKSTLIIGADKAANYQLVRGMFLDLAKPEESILLQRALGKPTHTGGALFKTTDAVYLRWLGWIGKGAREK